MAELALQELCGGAFEHLANKQWWAQGIAISYEQFIGRRIPGQRADGTFEATASKTIPVPRAQVWAQVEEHHLEPLTAFSKKYDKAENVAEGATVVINNDPANQIRGLKVLESAGLLKDIADEDTVLSIQDDEAKNPKKLKFNEVQAEQSPKFYQDDDSVDVAIINGNYILQAKLDVTEAIAVEDPENNPYANFLTWRAGEQTDAVKTLDELLHSEEVKKFIEETWDDGSVIPAF